ncbi:MAG: arginine--tRNA ligase [Candidatus Peregrinibacteria bacterium]
MENLLITQIQHLLKKAAKTADPIKVEYPLEESHGDYSSNIALQLAKKLNTNPHELALKIIKKIPKTPLISKVETAGPGFINFFINDQKLLKNYKPQKESSAIVIDFSSPNIAKPLGAHHLLSTTIGQSLYNILHHLGHKCIGINHIGDWGTQFGKLIVAYKKWGNKAKIEKDPTNELLKLYIKFHNEAEKTPQLEDEARKEFKKLENHDKENYTLWKWFVKESIKDLEKTYKNLGGIHFDHYHGESFYEDKMEPILTEGKKHKIFVKGEEGAFVVKYSDPNIPPFVVQKKDGATLYSTRDFATLKYRIETFKPEKILYVVDIAQTLHFKQLFEASKRFNWYKTNAVHVWFGRMHMKDKNMSTRKGNVILLDDLIKEAEKRAAHLKNDKKTAATIARSAIKYNILSQNRTTDIVFDWDKMLSLEGNSAPYIMYAYARAKSILRKPKTTTGHPQEDREAAQQKIHSLIRLFPRFPEKISESAKEYKPSILCTYLYELAQRFNSFYNSVPVIQASKKDQAHRLKITKKAAEILKSGLALLGVEVVEKM